ncbi:hypothetical protein MIMGU_mgv1a0221942mg, partial [Erythranthe guttata]
SMQYFSQIHHLHE